MWRDVIYNILYIYSSSYTLLNYFHLMPTLYFYFTTPQRQILYF